MPSVSYQKIILLWHVLHFVASLNAEESISSTSITGMANLLEIEMQLIEGVENYVTELKLKVDALKNLVDELKNENHKSINNREEYLFNPLKGFSLIRRLYNDWPKIELFLRKPVGQEYLSTLQKYQREMPNATDLMEASVAIYRLQTIYGLQVDDLVHGIINGKQYDAKLKSIDTYFMSSNLFTKKLYYAAALWLNYSINDFQNDNHHQILSFGKEQPLQLYAEVLILQNRVKEALKFITQASDLQPLDPYLLNRKNEIQILANTRNDSIVQFPSPLLTDYAIGCRGHFLDQTSKLFCVYNTTTTPFLRLAPLKMEILSLDPYIVIFHDVMYDQEIEHFKYLARPKLIRAGVYDHDLDDHVIDEERTSHLSWFEDDDDEIIKRFNKRVIDITGFDIFDSELTQIGNYGMGGHYNVHYDFFNVSAGSKLLAGYGDRISTLLFYLSDVEQGGATIFPKINVSVTPRKGSALFWYNLNNKMEADALTLHAACPVLVGSKWVVSKWIGAYAQTFIKPCYK